MTPYLRCHICGETLKPDDTIILCSMKNGADQVFIIGERCLPRVKDVMIYFKVKREAQVQD